MTHARITSIAVLAIACAMISSACSASPQGSASRSEEASQDIQEAMSGQELMDAIRFRTDYGLRADEGWIRQVASDPTSSEGRRKYGVPLTLRELAELDIRARHWREVGAVLREYGERHRDEYGGVFRDAARGDMAVIWFTSNIHEHWAALRMRLSPAARFEVRAAQFSVSRLNDFLERVQLAEDWFQRIHAPLRGWSILEEENAVEVLVSSRDPLIPGRIIAHFDGDDWLVVRPDGVGQWLGPRGNLIVQAATAEGRPVPDLQCVAIPDDPAALEGEVSWSTDERGTCRMTNLGATGYDVQLQQRTPRGPIVVGRGRADVPDNGEVVVSIVVKPDSGGS